MATERFACYLSGGSLPGMARVYPGARDRRPPLDSRGLRLQGQVYFALTSSVWGGGMAFLDPETPGGAAGRAYLITVEQFADVINQEMHREPSGQPFDIDGLLNGGRLQIGAGRYETLVVAGSVDDVPVVTFTAPEPQRPLNTPSPAYLRMLAAGLSAAHGWDCVTAANYLASLPGNLADAATITRWLSQPTAG